MQREFDSPLKRLVSRKNLQPIERAYVEAMNYVRLDPEIGMAKLQAILDLYEQPGRDSGPTEQAAMPDSGQAPARPASGKK